MSDTKLSRMAGIICTSVLSNDPLTLRMLAAYNEALREANPAVFESDIHEKYINIVDSEIDRILCEDYG
jgi:hypothetical protein